MFRHVTHHKPKTTHYLLLPCSRTNKHYKWKRWWSLMRGRENCSIQGVYGNCFVHGELYIPSSTGKGTQYFHWPLPDRAARSQNCWSDCTICQDHHEGVDLFLLQLWMCCRAEISFLKIGHHQGRWICHLIACNGWKRPQPVHEVNYLGATCKEVCTGGYQIQVM